MSAAVRQSLADAANTVEGVGVHPYYFQTATPGNGMVRLDHITYPNRFGGVVTWQVLVVLPQDLAGAEKYIDAHSQDLYEALSPELVVQSVTPVQMSFDGGAVPCLVIEGNREQE